MAIRRIQVVNEYGNAAVGIEAQVIPEIVPEYFASYTYTASPDWRFDFKDEDGVTVFSIDYDNNGNIECVFRYPGGISHSVSLGTGVDSEYMAFVYKCANGVVITVGALNPAEPSVTTDRHIIITKDKNGDTAVVVLPQMMHGGTTPAGTSLGYAIWSYASVYSDSGAPQRQYTVFTDQMTPARPTANQTQLVPFPTYTGTGETNYTPKAFLTPINQFLSSGWGKFIAGGKLYLTNGFIAIEDGEVSA